MHWFLQTLSGQRTVPEACAALEVGPSRFFAQRAAWLQEALALLEPRSPGRPPSTRPTPSATELSLLTQRVQELEAQLAAAQVEAELSAALPHVVRRARSLKKTTKRLAAGRLHPAR
jgi:hypothetical protein